MLFADLLSLHLVTFLMFFILVHVTFLSSRCMLELKFAIYSRAASLPSQASYSVLAQESLTRPGFLQTLPTHNSISNSAILCNNYILLLSDLCACVHVKKKWCRKGSHSSSVSGSNHFVWLQTWKIAMGWCTAQLNMLLFCAKTIVKESRKYWTSPSEEEEEQQQHFGHLATFWFGTFVMLFSATGCCSAWKHLKMNSRAL